MCGMFYVHSMTNIEKFPFCIPFFLYNKCCGFRPFFDILDNSDANDFFNPMKC